MSENQKEGFNPDPDVTSVSIDQLSYGQKMVRVFLPLYQAAKEKQAISGLQLDQALYKDEVELDSEVVANDRRVLIQSLRSRFAPLGMEIENIYNPKVIWNQTERYSLDLGRKPFITDIFLRVAVLDGAHLERPSKNLSDQRWARMRNILGIYYGTDLVTEDLRLVCGFTNRERVSQLIEKGLWNLWENCSPEVQAAFPLEQLVHRKPTSLRSRERSSLARGGKSVKVAEMAAQGKTPEEIISTIGSVQALVSSRIVLSSWGIEIPYIQRGQVDNGKLMAELQAEEDPEKLQELLGQASIHFYRSNTKGKTPFFLSVDRTIRRAGYHPTTRQLQSFFETLKQAHVPVGDIPHPITGKTYYFILARYKEAAIKALMENQGLRSFWKNPVVQILGVPTDNLPTTYDVVFGSSKYGKVGLLLRRMGGSYGYGRLTLEQLLTDCPVPIFKYSQPGKVENNFFVYPIEHEEELGSFIRSKLPQRSHSLKSSK